MGMASPRGPCVAATISTVRAVSRRPTASVVRTVQASILGDAVASAVGEVVPQADEIVSVFLTGGTRPSAWGAQGQGGPRPLGRGWPFPGPSKASVSWHRCGERVRERRVRLLADQQLCIPCSDAFQLDTSGEACQRGQQGRLPGGMVLTGRFSIPQSAAPEGGDSR